MWRWIMVLLIASLLVGCAARWESDTKRRSDFYADDRDCQVIAGSASQGIDPNNERTSYESCMWERGWRKKTTFWFFNPSDK